MSKSENEYIVNLIGQGIRYWICSIQKEDFETMLAIKNEVKKPWSELLFDLDFLAIFDYAHWSELAQYNEKTGLILCPENIVEIRKNGKLVEKFSASALQNKNVILPLYLCNQFKIQPEENANFIILQYERGLIGKYIFSDVKLNIDHLIFELQTFDDPKTAPPILGGLIYKNQLLESQMDDTLITNLQVFDLL
jgi:hypothetical protein